MLGALRSPGIRTLVLVTVPMGFCFGAMEVTLPAFGEDHGAASSAGVLRRRRGRWAAPRAASGTAPGTWTAAGAQRYARLAALLPIGYLPLALAPSVLVMAPLALLAGLCIAPTLTAGNQIAGDVAPPGAETEAYTWPITALVVGLAIGNGAPARSSRPPTGARRSSSARRRGARARSLAALRRERSTAGRRRPRRP